MKGRRDAPARIAPAARPRRGRVRPETWLAVAFIAPTILIVCGVYLYPAVATLLYSFSELEVASLRIDRFVGLEHFRGAVASEEFKAVVLRTLYFGLMVVVLTTVPAFLIALLLKERFRGRNFLRVIVLLPWALPPVVSGVLWSQMFHADFGFINGLIRTAGGEGNIIWLGDPVLALHAVIIAEVWRWIPFATLFILAGLQTIPPETYEAASVDGANAWQKFRYLTVPLMWPILLPVTIFMFVWAMKAFDTIFVLTQGGPRMGTTTLNYLVYRQSFQEFSFGQAAATAYILSLLTLLVIAVLAFLRWRARIRSGEVAS
ncbi:sugar ABC transporter permease [Rubrobacter taiwanensis]|uniref:Sugar ABC transporter permease n=1 Tax=Rubrobacter taiwanensis TaxID=185139 RepID=A0A4R1BF29_9ACTN|nr:sugar ABC transporter permease [Rubrobacter taiwanensis]TCJ15628.1 sugar ABC transporter permease [Rubrobacter taiwanensis]